MEAGARSPHPIAITLAMMILAGAWSAGAVEALKLGEGPIDDATLARRVEQRISGRPGVDSARVIVSVADGVLALSGAVPSLHDRAEIEMLAAGVRGLSAIENKIEVERGTDPDPVLENNARRALDLSPRLRGFGLRISVAEAILTIEGEVTLARDRVEAEEIASAVRGVLDVENRIRLAPYPLDPPFVQRRLVRLLSNRLILGGVDDLRVSVTQEGEVTLEGIVATAADRMQAERLAYGIRGVASVRNGLQVRRFPRRSAPPAEP